MKNHRLLSLALLTFSMITAFDHSVAQTKMPLAELGSDTPVRTITIHANLDAQTAAPTWLRRIQAFMSNDFVAELEVVTRGHAWISVKDGSSCRTYGLFDKGATRDLEAKYQQGIVRTKTITESEMQRLEEAISLRNDYRWTGYYNCATYAADLWEAATGERLNVIPEKLFAIKNGVISANSSLKPLPPSPLGLMQEFLRLSEREGSTVISSESLVCP